MAWSRDKVDSNTINNGNEYVKGDRVSRQSLNAMVNSGLYSQDFVEALADSPVVENDETGASPSVELVDNIKNGKTYKKFKFKNLGSGTGTGTNENALTTDDLVREFDIETEYQPESNKVYNAYSINMLMGLFSDEISWRDEVIGGKAEKDASNLDATNITQWQTKLNTATQSDLNETNSRVSTLANTVKEHTSALVNKVDKKSNSTSYNQVYAVLPTQEQKTIPATDENIASSIVMRDENGKIQASTPVADNDVVNKYYVDAIDSKKVDKVSGKGLSTKDYTEGDKLKLDSIEWGAEENVQSDWNVTDTTSKAFIKNKPVIPQGSVLYDSTGQNTDGAMTQKSTTNALSSKADKTELEKKLNLSGGVITGDLTLESTGDQSLSNRLKFNTRNNNSPSIGYATDKTDGTFLITSGLNYKRQADGLSFDGTSGELLWKNVRVATINDIPTDYVTETELTNKGYATNSKLSEYLPLSGGTLAGGVVLSGGSGATGAGNIQLSGDGSIADVSGGTLFGRSNSGKDLKIGSSTYNMLLRGKQTRPTYNGNDLALFSDASNGSRLVTDYTLSSASSSINLTGLDLIADGGIYDVVVVYKTNAGTDTYVTVNNITSNSYKSFTLACYGNSKTATSVGNVTLNKFQAGSIYSTNEGTLSFTLIQNSTSSAQYLFKAISNDGTQLYYRDGGGYVSLSSSINSIQISTSSPIQAGARIRIYARAK